MNIFSGERGLGAALTNPTSLAFKKGTLSRILPIKYMGMNYNDAEAAYQALKTGDVKTDDELMSEIICAKFTQHPLLFEETQVLGGSAFLQTCTHFTGARSTRFKAWEGRGLESRFIRNLVLGYKKALVDKGLCPDCGLDCNDSCAEVGL